MGFIYWRTFQVDSSRSKSNNFWKIFAFIMSDLKTRIIRALVLIGEEIKNFEEKKPCKNLVRILKLYYHLHVPSLPCPQTSWFTWSPSRNLPPFHAYLVRVHYNLPSQPFITLMIITHHPIYHHNHSCIIIISLTIITFCLPSSCATIITPSTANIIIIILTV